MPIKLKEILNQLKFSKGIYMGLVKLLGFGSPIVEILEIFWISQASSADIFVNCGEDIMSIG
jgi:hypothetical protein